MADLFLLTVSDALPGVFQGYRCVIGASHEPAASRVVEGTPEEAAAWSDGRVAF